MVIIVEEYVPDVSFETISACILGNACSGFAVYYGMQSMDGRIEDITLLELAAVSSTLLLQQLWISVIPQIYKTGSSIMRLLLASAGVGAYGVYILLHAYEQFIHSF